VEKTTKRKNYICRMEISTELIDRLANLSMLTFSEDEKEQLRSDLQKMTGFIDKLLELDTTGVEPLRHITGNFNLTRDDVVSNELKREDVFLNAPNHDGQYFKVPKVLKK